MHNRDSQSSSATPSLIHQTWQRFMDQNVRFGRYLARVHRATLEREKETHSMFSTPKRMPIPALQRKIFTTTPLVFTERDLAEGRVGRVVSELMALVDDTQSVRENASRFSLRFEGLRHDRREVYEIPAVTLFFRAVHDQWPYWMHFLAPTPENLALVLLLLSEDAFTMPQATPAQHQRPMARARIVDRRSAESVVENLFATMAVLHAQCGIDLNTTQSMRDQFVNHPIYREITRIPGNHKD